MDWSKSQLKQVKDQTEVCKQRIRNDYERLVRILKVQMEIGIVMVEFTATELTTTVAAYKESLEMVVSGIDFE